MAFRRTFNPMDYAKRYGRESRVSDMMRKLELQQKALPGEMAQYQQEKGVLDIGTNIASSLATDWALKSLMNVIVPGSGVVAGLVGGAKEASEGFEKLSAMSDLTKGALDVAGKGVKGGTKSVLSSLLSGVLGDVFKIKPPEAPTVDIGKLTGPGTSRARGSIADALETSKVALTGDIKDYEGSRTMANFLMSFGPELEEPLFGESSIMDWFRGRLGLDSFQ